MAARPIINVVDEDPLHHRLREGRHEGEAEVPTEMLVKGDTAILGELYFQLGNVTRN